MWIRKFIYGACLLSVAAHGADEYCVAIRGNGENAAAHWAALSRLVEEKGMPERMAGGSSATVSMFFVDSIAGNPAVTGESDPSLKRKKEALLLKSIGEFVAEMGRTDEVVSAQQFAQQLSSPNSGLKAKLTKLVVGTSALTNRGLRRAVGKFSPLLNPELVRGILRSPKFFSEEGKGAIAAAGRLDAGNKNLFFRPGLVDFKEFALNLGQIADFYQGNTDDKIQGGLTEYLSTCAEKVYEKEWGASDADCKKQFRALVAKYLRQGKFQHKALFQPIGSQVPSIPTTSLLVGDAVKRYRDLKASYAAGKASSAYDAFKVNFDQELKFGYWTPDDAKITRGLSSLKAKGDLKSDKFFSLKPGNWFEVLATSPAEPGLANVQAIPVDTTRDQVLAERRKPANTRWRGLSYLRTALSAGGWSDLHPVPVLKAAGCSRVVYLTRQDGETIFGQQVFLRLTGEQNEVPFWQRIAEQNNTGWDVAGTSAEKTAWHKLYNLRNPESSFNRSLALADATYCTNWNRFEPFKGETAAMQKQAYEAPIFVVSGTSASFRLNGDVAPNAAKYPGCLAKKAVPVAPAKVVAPSTGVSAE